MSPLGGLRHDFTGKTFTRSDVLPPMTSDSDPVGNLSRVNGQECTKEAVAMHVRLSHDEPPSSGASEVVGSKKPESAKEEAGMVDNSRKWNEDYAEDWKAKGWEEWEYFKWWETSWLGQSWLADNLEESEVLGSQGSGVYPRPALVVKDQTCALGPPTWIHGPAPRFQGELCED